MLKKLLNSIFFLLIVGTIGVASVKGIEFSCFESTETIELTDFNENDGEPIDDDEKELSLEIEFITLLQSITTPDRASYPSPSLGTLPTYFPSYFFRSIKPPMA